MSLTIATPYTNAQQHSAEDFLMGRGAADAKGAIAYHDSSQAFSIVPLHFSKGTLVFCLLGLVIALIIYEFFNSSSKGNPTPNYKAVLFAFLFTVGFFGPFIWILNRRAKRIGPLFIFEKQSGSVVLPKQNCLFERNQILFVQIITGFEGKSRDGMQCTEVNLVAMVDGKRMRWPVVGRIVNYGKVSGVFNKMIAETDLPVMRFKQQWKQEKMSIEIKDLRESKDYWWST